MRLRKILIITCLLLLNTVFAQTVKRSRNEGTMYIPSSNVMGNGNIIAFADINGILTNTETYSEVGTSFQIGAGIGIAELLQFTAMTSFVNFQKLGPTEAHLQVTLPGNDRLRFFGFAIIGDLYLSTSLDTLNEDADKTKPEYNPYPLLSTIVDFDWMSRPKQLPIKTYISVSLADKPSLLFEYNQIAIKSGVEWKMYKHSLFLEAGVNMFKEKNPPNTHDARFDQNYGWISPGGRYRIRNRFSIMGNLKIRLFANTSVNSSLKPESIILNIKFEAPIVFRESDAEAIRTLVFVEKNKKGNLSKQYSDDQELDNSLMGKFQKTLQSLDEEDETFDYTKEEDDLVKRRKEVEKKMEDIEKLLEEDKD